MVVNILLLKILGLKSPKLIYVESFARVQRLSLSGKLLRPLVDRWAFLHSVFYVLNSRIFDVQVRRAMARLA